MSAPSEGRRGQVFFEMDSPVETRFGERIRALRTERGWTQGELARQMGEAGFPMSQPIVANLEAGKRPTRVAEIEALANLFNVPMAQLFSAPTNGERSALEVARQAEACDEAAASFTRSLMATQRLHSALVESSERLAQAIGKAPDPDDHQVAQTVDRAHSVLSFALGIAGQFYTIGGPNSILSYQQPEESGDGEH